MCTVWCLSTKQLAIRCIGEQLTLMLARILFIFVSFGRQPVIPIGKTDDWSWPLVVFLCSFSSFVLLFFYFIFFSILKRCLPYVFFYYCQRKQFLHANTLHKFMRQDFHLQQAWQSSYDLLFGISNVVKFETNLQKKPIWLFFVIIWLI